MFNGKKCISFVVVWFYPIIYSWKLKKIYISVIIIISIKRNNDSTVCHILVRIYISHVACRVNSNRHNKRRIYRKETVSCAVWVPCEWVITLARLGHHSGAEFQAKIGKEEDEGEVFSILLAFLKPWWICGGLFLVNSDNEHDLFFSLEIRLQEKIKEGVNFDRHFSNV